MWPGVQSLHLMKTVEKMEAVERDCL